MCKYKSDKYTVNTVRNHVVSNEGKKREAEDSIFDLQASKPSWGWFFLKISHVNVDRVAY